MKVKLSAQATEIHYFTTNPGFMWDCEGEKCKEDQKWLIKFIRRQAYISQNPRTHILFRKTWGLSKQEATKLYLNDLTVHLSLITHFLISYD